MRVNVLFLCVCLCGCLISTYKWRQSERANYSRARSRSPISLQDSLLGLHLDALVLHCMRIWWQILYLIYSAFLPHTCSISFNKSLRFKSRRVLHEQAFTLCGCKRPSLNVRAFKVWEGSLLRLRVPLCVYTLVCVFVMSKSSGNAVSTVTISLGGPSLIVCLVLMI